FRGGLEVRAVAGLVTERPDDDAGMIFVALDHANGAVQVSVRPLRSSGETSFSETHAMAFDVGFVDEIKPIAITQIVPGRLIWIMRATHGIDIELLHTLDVGFHALKGDGLASIRIEFVAIDTFNEDAFAVEQEIAVSDRDFTKSNGHRNDFINFAGPILQAEEQLV